MLLLLEFYGFCEKSFDKKKEFEYFFCTESHCSKKMLKNIFGSGARVKLLQQFLVNPDEEFFIRELTRILDEQINSLRRELENLEKIGMLKSTERNRKKYYRVNPHFLLLHELTSVVRKTQDSNKQFLKKISKLGSIEMLVLGRNFVGDRSDDNVDIFLVGDVSKAELESFIEENFAGENLKYTLMSKEDFLYRITLKDKFVKNVLTNRDNIILKNKLKKDTEVFL